MNGINWLGLLVDQVNDLITANGGALVHYGLVLLAWIALFKLLMLVIPMLLRRLDLLGTAAGISRFTSPTFSSCCFRWRRADRNLHDEQ